MKQINNSPDKSVLLRETFNSEASVRLNGGVCANVDFESGKAFFQNTGSITYSNPVLSIGAFTIRARVKLTIVNQYNVIASFDNVSTIELRTDLGGELVMYVDSVKKSSGKVLAVNTWYDIVVTRDDSGVIIFYVNGESFSGGTQAGTFYNKNLTIGKRGAGTTLYYNGYMDLFEYYDRSMTAAEITYILNDRAFRITDQVKRDRVAISGGTQGKIIDYKSLITFYRKRGMWDKTHICLVPFLGYKASSGLIDTVYDLKGSILKNNDGTQGTTANKPRVAGNIAPSEVLSMQNPNGDARFMTHPAISFAANQAWSVTFVFNDSHSDINSILYSNLSNVHSAFYLRTFSVGNWQVYTGDGANWSFSIDFNIVKNRFGKNTVVTFVYNTDRILVYVNGIYIGQSNQSGGCSWVFSSVFTSNPSRPANVRYYFHRIQSGAMTATQVAAEHDKLRTYIPEIETVQIGSKYITSSNFQAVATPAGNVIQEMQAASAVEKITNGDFAANVTGWTAQNATLTWNAGGYADITNDGGTVGLLSQGSKVTTIGWKKVSYKVKSATYTGQIRFSLNSGTDNTTVPGNVTSDFVQYTIYFKVTTAGTFSYYFRHFLSTAGIVVSFDDVSVKDLGWSDAEELYNGLIAQGYTAANALKEVAMWCSYENSTLNQSIYGKQYNHYAKELLKADMLAQSFGYHITTESEWTALAALGGYKLRKEGTTYWSEATGTNTTGFTALGGGKRLTSGVFQGLLTNVAYWVGDTQKVVIISGDTVTIQAANTQEGNYIRLTKD